VSGAGNVRCNILDVSHAYNTGSQGTVNLNGGTLAVNNVITDTGNVGTTNGAETATFNFNGGTLQARQNNATFISQSGPGGPTGSSNIVLNLIVQSGGAVIDTAGFNVTNVLVLQHDSTLGATNDGGLTKLGAGILGLVAANDYTGNTTVSGGTLALRGSSAVDSSSGISVSAGATLDVSGRTDGKLTLLSGQTLGGSGAVSGALQVNAGAIVAPGPGLGVLTVSGNASLSGTAAMELNKTSGTNDVLKVNGSLTYGGTLALTNLLGTLANGNSFKLFTATSYSGAFTNITPVMPGSGLAWDASGLVTNGTLRVITARSPKVTGLTLAGTNLLVAGGNGIPNGTYYFLTTTNLLLPLNQWTVIATNTFDSGGNFSFINPANPNAQRAFYRLKLQ
jgi:autotransporter-associated beta strand protein